MIIRDTERVKQYTGINKNLSWDSLKPFVMQAEQKFAKPVLGDYYSILDAAITNDTLAPGEEELLEYIYPMIANFSLYLAAPMLNIHISDLGFQELSSKEGTSNPASITRYNDARLALWRTADDYREFAYTHLQNNQQVFHEWADSAACSIYSELFLRSNTELHEHLGMGSSVSTYLALKAHIKFSEFKYIQPILCDALIAELKAANKSNDLTADQSKLMDIVKPALAWLALYEAAPTLKAVIEDGLLITALPSERSKMFQPMTKEQTDELRADADEKGSMYLSALKQFMDKNADTYPLYQNSPCNKKRQGEYSLPDNSCNKSFGLY